MMKNNGVNFGNFRRMSSTKQSEYLEKIFNTQTQILFQSNTHDALRFRKWYKTSNKNILRIAIKGEGDQLGMKEWILGWPYYTTSAKWVSKTATIFAIE